MTIRTGLQRLMCSSRLVVVDEQIPGIPGGLGLFCSGPLICQGLFLEIKLVVGEPVEYYDLTLGL
jgi:hypothetical protein